MNERLRALALIRASLLEDAETITLLLADGPPSEELVRHLAGISSSFMEVPLGADRALATLDKFLRLTLEQA